MTQSEFIKRYCEKSKITEEELNSKGQFAVPCSKEECDYENCEGWIIKGVVPFKAEGKFTTAATYISNSGEKIEFMCADSLNLTITEIKKTPNVRLKIYVNSKV